MFTNRWSAMLLLVASLVTIIAIEHHRVNRERTRAAILALSVSNGIAQRDSTRRVALENQKVALLLGDTLSMFEKKVVQATQQRDALDRALRTERIARYAMVAVLSPMHRESVAAETQATATGMRRAVFNVREAPYDVHAEVEIPSLPDTARLSVRVRLDPLHLNVRLSCGASDGNGIRGASITAEMPTWASVRFNQVEQSPDLCASPALSRSASSRGVGAFIPLLVGAGRVLGANGLNSWGVFIGAGIRFTH